MNKTGKTTIYLSSMLVLVILTSSIYIFMPGQVKLETQGTRSLFSVWEDDAWVLSATEYMYMYDGTTKMRRNYGSLFETLICQLPITLNGYCGITYNTIGDITTIIRTSKYKNNISTIQTYKFDSSVIDISMFPIDESATCINCVGKIVHFEYRDILYDGITEVISHPFSFGHNMKIDWQDGAYYSKVFQQKVAADKIIIRYRPVNNSETYEIRLFDPPKKKITIWYEEKVRTVPVYKTRVIKIPEECWFNSTLNIEQCSPAHEYEETYIDSYKKEKYNDKIGINIEGKKVKNPYNIEGDYVSYWNIPIGDRDFEDFGRCREYEIEKGVCSEVSLLK